MKPEEAIRELSCMREGARNHGYKGKEYWFKWIAGEGFGVITIAIQALEKQVPKKPERLNAFRSIGKCGGCERVISARTASAYCQYCGNKVDWGNEE